MLPADAQKDCQPWKRSRANGFRKSCTVTCWCSGTRASEACRLHGPGRQPFPSASLQIVSRQPGGILVSGRFLRSLAHYFSSCCGANLGTHQRQNPLGCLLKCRFLDSLKWSLRPMSGRIVSELLLSPQFENQ